MSGLAAIIQEELDRQGRKWAWLAAETGLAPSAFTKWKSVDGNTVPELPTLALVSGKLGIPLIRLIEACGYAVNESADYNDRQARARALVASVPRLAEVAGDLAGLRPEDQDALMSLIETYLRDRRLRRRGRKGS
jgi:hypothetical protein